mmetsp:Transcript_55932/g.131972  ORF Transcript_55932/g.131972 Transcript_55932/m.131972 type:complete len:214 (+) Transcript_55932:429-1070(+)
MLQSSRRTSKTAGCDAFSGGNELVQFVPELHVSRLVAMAGSSIDRENGDRPFLDVGVHCVVIVLQIESDKIVENVHGLLDGPALELPLLALCDHGDDVGPIGGDDLVHDLELLAVVCDGRNGWLLSPLFSLLVCGGEVAVFDELRGVEEGEHGGGGGWNDDNVRQTLRSSTRILFGLVRGSRGCFEEGLCRGLGNLELLHLRTHACPLHNDVF